jgi:peptidoglycan hydrolase-like protein with peptidoglycan-binding domain
MSYAMHGLGFDGLGADVPVVDPVTGATLVEHPTAEEVGCGSALGLQQMLKDLGYYQGPIDGLFTIDTFASLQHFTVDVGVPYRPGTYPTGVVCSAVMAAWDNKQGSKGPYPLPGSPVVMPGITPADRIAGVRAAVAAAAKCAKAEKPSIAASGLWGLAGILGLAAFGGFGAFDPTTMPTIRKGSTEKAAVITWQSFLLGQGYSQVGTADGVFGTNTHNATIAWQDGNGLKPGDGIVGPKTWAAAAAKLVSSVPVPVPTPGVPVPVPTSPPPVPPPGGTTTGTTPPPSGTPTTPEPPPQNPIERAQAWWTNQPKTTQYAIMGGGAVVLLGLLVVATSGKKAKPQTAQPNRRRYRKNASKRRGRRCRRTAPKRYRRMGAKRRSDYADPACWGYPVRARKGRRVLKRRTKKLIRAAASRFGKYGSRYPKTVRRRIRARIRRAERRYAIGPYRSR